MVDSSFMIDFIQRFLYYSIGTYLGLLIPLVALVAVFQERKLWKPAGLPSLTLWGMWKVFMFNASWMFGCYVAAVMVVLKKIVTLGTSNLADDGNQLGEGGVSWLLFRLWVGRLKLVGEENLPVEEREKPAPIYVANHCTQQDAGSPYMINRRFVWIAKDSVQYIPGVGLIMSMSGHVFIKRKGKDKKASIVKLMADSNQAIAEGRPIFFFPQGTRAIHKRLPFKDGAFTLAIENQTRLIPISLDTPLDAWNSAYPLSLLWGGASPTITVTVHKPVPVTKESTKEDLKEKCMAAIYSALPNIVKAEALHSAATTEGGDAAGKKNS